MTSTVIVNSDVAHVLLQIDGTSPGDKLIGFLTPPRRAHIVISQLINCENSSLLTVLLGVYFGLVLFVIWQRGGILSMM